MLKPKTIREKTDKLKSHTIIKIPNLKNLDHRHIKFKATEIIIYVEVSPTFKHA